MIRQINFYVRLLEQNSDDAHNISVNPSASNLDWQTGDYDDITVDVTPDSMSTTITKVDTGDGTTWFAIDHTTATGDFTLRISAAKDNTTGSTRHGIVRIEDDDFSTVYAEISVSQITEPV